MHGDEALGGTWRFEPLHLAFSSAERLMGDLGPVVLVSPLLMIGVQADLLERSPIGAQLVGCDPSGGKAVLFEQLADELARGGLVPPALDQDLQHLAFIINCSPQVHILAGNTNLYLIEMPARAPFAPQMP